MPNPISILSKDPKAEVGTASRIGITDATHALVDVRDSPCRNLLSPRQRRQKTC
jgi:hypothetical protein